jgi:hypothetical protein
VKVEVLSSHFSRRRSHDVWLHWHYTGMDAIGNEHSDLARGRAKISFKHHRVELARALTLPLPAEPMLCTLSVAAVTREGEVVAGNFVQHLVAAAEPPPEREVRGKTLVLRRRVDRWDAASWTGNVSKREDAKRDGLCFGEGVGFFEWHLADEAIERLHEARRVRLLCEVSARRRDISQTDSHRFPSNFELLLNDLPVHRALLPDHPHDTRGALSYLRGGRGAYGYLMRVALEDDLLQRVARTAQAEGVLRFCCSVPDEAEEPGGLSIYEFDCGRFPIGPTVVIEWEQG